MNRKLINLKNIFTGIYRREKLPTSFGILFLCIIFMSLLVNTSCISSNSPPSGKKTHADSNKTKESPGRINNNGESPSQNSPFSLRTDNKTDKLKQSPSPEISPLTNQKSFESKDEEMNYILVQGTKFMENRKFKEAEALFTRGLELEPDSFTLYDKRSMNYYNMGAHKKGLEDCNRAIEIAKKEGVFSVRCPRGPLARRGAHYFNLKQYDRAIKDFRTVIKYSPDFAFAYYDLGQCYFQKGELKIAKKYFLKAIDLKEDKRITQSAEIYLEKIKNKESIKKQN